MRLKNTMRKNYKLNQKSISTKNQLERQFDFCLLTFSNYTNARPDRYFTFFLT